jgi:hypothetical protein
MQSYSSVYPASIRALLLELHFPASTTSESPPAAREICGKTCNLYVLTTPSVNIAENARSLRPDCSATQYYCFGTFFLCSNVKFISVGGSMEYSSQEGDTQTGFDHLRHFVYSIHTPQESEAQPKTATRIHLPIHLGNTLMENLRQPSQPGARPVTASQLRRSRLGPEARQNLSNVFVRLLRRARTVNKLPSPAHRRLLKDEEGRWPRPVSVCGFMGLGSNFACSLSRLCHWLARSLERSLSLALSLSTPTHARTHASILTPLKTLAMESQKWVIQRSAHGRLWLAL